MTGMHNELDLQHRMWDFAQGGRDAELERHIVTCSECQDQLFALRQLARLSTTAGGALAEPPAALTVQVSSLLARIRSDLVAQPQALSDKMRVRLRQVAASLLVDTGLTPRVAGVRADGDRSTRQLVFSSEVADLDLEVSRTDDDYAVAGQLGMDVVPENLSIRFVPADHDPLHAKGPDVIETGISRQGYFNLSIAAGDWIAAVTIDDAVVLFPGVRL